MKSAAFKTILFLGIATPSLLSCTQKTANSAEQQPSTGFINGHEYVDLGLSVKWATCNVGASSPADIGDYYAWGETETKSSYTDENSLTDGEIIGSIAGNAQYDVARANWGDSWRLPTGEEIDELISRCEKSWTTQAGQVGYQLTGPNGNSLFLPAAGWWIGSSLTQEGEQLYYWSATPYGDFTNSSYYLGLYNGYLGRYWCNRGRGQSVRPVSD